MNYLDGMGPRQSIAAELLDTVRFGAIDKIKGASGYAKKKLDKGDAYVLPFGRSKDEFGAIIIRSPKSIEVKFSVNGEKSSVIFKKVHDAKQFLIRKFIV